MSEDHEKDGPNQMVFLQQFMMLVLQAELEVHRDLLCQLMEKSNPAQDAAKTAIEIPQMVDRRIHGMLAGMADVDANAAAAFAKLLELRRKQRQT